MPPLIWAPTAAADVQRLYRFLAPKDVNAARLAARTIREAVKVLGTHSRLGRMIEDLPEQYREWVIDFGDSGYVAIYRIDNDALTILAVRHQKEAGY